MPTPQERMRDWLLAQVGYVADGHKRTRYGELLDSLGFYNGAKNGYDWCDQFYDAGLVEVFGADLAYEMTGQFPGCGGAGCWISAQYYRESGQWSTSPSLSAQIFFGPLYDEGHTGGVVAYTDETVTIVDGNSGYGDGYSTGAVLKHTYYRNDPNIAGYGVPHWRLAEGDEVTDSDIEKVAQRVVAELTKRDASGLSPLGIAVLGAKNTTLETEDVYQILRDVRNALGIQDGQKLPTAVAREHNTPYEEAALHRIEQALAAIERKLG